MTPPVEAPITPTKRSKTSLILTVILCVFGLGCLAMIVGAFFLFPVLRQARIARGRAEAVSRMHSLASATLVYAGENDDRLPPADSWMDDVAKFDSQKRDFRSPGLPFTSRGYGVAFMSSLGGVKLSTVANPADRVMIFDSTLMQRNAASGLETVPKPPRFGRAETGGNVIAFVDGHAKLVTAADGVNLK